MSKLAPERLDKLQDNLLQFQDSYGDPADKENYDIFVDALHMLDEFKAAKEKLLAYEQAGKETKIYQYQSCLFNDENGETDWYWDDCDKGFFEQYDPAHRRIVYAAPVLPKQPELVDLSQQVEMLNRILNWILKELPVPTQKATVMAIRLSSVIDIISELEVSVPAQIESEIPFGDVEPIEVTDAMVYAFHNQLSDSALGSDEFTDIKHGLCAALMNIPRPAQPVSEPYKLPSGWKLVPEMPTLEMVRSARKYHEGENYLPASLYRAMLAAAPAQESE